MKKNSLFGTEVPQTQDNINSFCHKIREGKSAQVTDEFMIIARIESLILGKGVDDAIERSRAYLEAGADGILIHSCEKDVKEIQAFCHRYREFEIRPPLFCVPTTYNHLTEYELEELGFSVVIHANQLLRAAYPAMRKTAQSILRHGRSLEAEEDLLPIREILKLIPGGE